MTATVLVRTVARLPQKRSDAIRWVFMGTVLRSATDTRPFVSVTTFDHWRASLCQRAYELDQPITWTYHRTKYFDDTLDAVEFPVKESHAGS